MKNKEKSNFIIKIFLYFYKDKLLYYIIYLILSIIFFFIMLAMYKFSKLFLSQNKIDIKYVFSYIFLLLIYFIVSHILYIIDAKKLLFGPLSNMMNGTLQKILQKKYEYFCKGDKDSYFYYIFELPQMILNFIPSFFYIISFAIRVIFSFVYVFLIFPFPLLLSLIFFLFFQYFLQLRQKKEIEYWKISNEKSKNLTNLIIQYLRAIWTIKVYSLQKFCYDKITTIENEYSKSLTLFHFLNKLYFVLVDGQNYFLQMIFILFVIIFNLDTNIGRIIISLFFYETFTHGFSIILLNLKEIKQNSKNAQDLINIIEDDDKEKGKIQLLDVSRSNNDLIISINNCSFAYQYENHEIPLFNDISLDIMKKDKIVIIGENGSGKTTLLKILANIITIKDKIKYSSLLIDKDKLSTTGLKISFVSTFPHIFHISLKQNIAVNENIDNNLVENILDDLRLKKLCNDLPEKLDTIIDFNSLTLSDGEKVRLAIARTLYLKDNSEILFLDEFSKNLDSLSENIVINRIFDEYKDKIIIAVSHRLSTILKFDKILYVDKNDHSIHLYNKEKLMKIPKVINLFNNIKSNL